MSEYLQNIINETKL